MKKVIFAAIALMGLSTAGLAQTSAAAKTQPVKMQVTKKASATQAPQSKVATAQKTTASSVPSPEKSALCTGDMLLPCFGYFKIISSPR